MKENRSRVSWLQKAATAAEKSDMAMPPIGDWVYFIDERQPGGGGMVKIGRARNIPKRLRELQTSNSSELRPLAWTAGGHDLEQCLHGTLDEYLVRGEWFQGCDMVWDVANGLHGRKALDWADLKQLFIKLGLRTSFVDQWLRAA